MKKLKNKKYYYLKVKKQCFFHKHETEPDWFLSQHGIIVPLYFLKEQAEKRAKVYPKKEYKVKVMSCSIKEWFEDD